MKKILIIAYSSTPLTAPRGTQANRLINKLSDNYSIFLITSSKSTSDTVSYFNKNITITSIKSTNKKILSLISKILSFWSVFDTYWFIQSVFKSLLINK